MERPSETAGISVVAVTLEDVREAELRVFAAADKLIGDWVSGRPRIVLETRLRGLTVAMNRLSQTKKRLQAGEGKDSWPPPMID